MKAFSSAVPDVTASFTIIVSVGTEAAISVINLSADIGLDPHRFFTNCFQEFVSEFLVTAISVLRPLTSSRYVPDIVFSMAGMSFIKVLFGSEVIPISVGR